MSNQDPFQPSGARWDQPAPGPYGQSAADPYAVPASYGQAAPVYGQDAFGAPAYGTPAIGAPAYGTPEYGTPAYGAPADGAPTFSPPAYGSPAYGAPTVGYPGYFVGFGVIHASWGQRVGAYLLDSLALLPYWMGAIIGAVASPTTSYVDGVPVSQPNPAGALAFVLGAFVSFGLWGWNRWVRGGRTGQSWGKKALGLTMQRDGTGEPLGIWMAFVRDVAHYVDGFFYLGYLWPLWDAKRQTFSDKLTKTVVVS
ncbi:RDD family protein [Cellulomonas sp. Leaf395]|uniref:RDD family protein n=1 Tax=Cellulomonas sp. Leaf395 TaxID=1736362 RepID=UPI000AF7BFC5|nr:RDD family protein [Cellulomonas sp. Leaf395]